MSESSSRHHQVKCCFCSSSPLDAKLLPCLHVACGECLVDDINSLVEYSSGQKLFSCSICSQKTLISKSSGITEFKDCGFLLSSQCNGSYNSNSHDTSVHSTCHDITKQSKSDDIDKLSTNGDVSVKPDHVNMQSNCHEGSLHLTSNGLGLGLGNVSNNNNNSMENRLGPLEENFCYNCEVVFAESDLDTDHLDHKFTTVREMLNVKRNHLQKLCDDVSDCRQHHRSNLLHLQQLQMQMLQDVDAVRSEIITRAELVCDLIKKRKDTLLMELDRLCSQQMQINNELETEICRKDEMLENASLLTNVFLNTYDNCKSPTYVPHIKDAVHISDLCSSALLRVTQDDHVNPIPLQTFKLEIPDQGKEDSHLEKLYGSLVMGNFNFGQADVIGKLDLDIHWPSSMCFSKHNEFVIAGKTGALESSGKVLFYNRVGRLVASHSLDFGYIPYDAVLVPSPEGDTVLISDSNGSVTKFSLSGQLLDKWSNLFQNGGKLALTMDNTMLVSTSEKSGDRKTITEFNTAGIRLHTDNKLSELSISANHFTMNSRRNLVILDSLHEEITVINWSTGDVVLKAKCPPEIDVQCVSGICCDIFGNILIADFKKDSIYLLSSSAVYLGCIVNKENGVSCPTCLCLNVDGHLLIGQYGGEVLIFRYLSLIKHA